MLANIARSTHVFYVTDKGFAVPTIASIESLRRWNSAADIEINVVLLGMSTDEISAFMRTSDDLRVQIHTLSTDKLQFFDKTHFNKTHVPYSTLARFLIPEFIGFAADKDILYIDGDTWFLKDPEDLLQFAAPKTGILAAEDQSYFYRNDIGSTGRDIKSYFGDIGVSESTGYFNAGVIKSRADEWARICDDCIAYLADNLTICRYHDQSALNAVVSARRMRLSPVWNFQTPYWNWNLSDIAEPKLLHFVGGGKPWMGMLRSWSGIYAPYSQVVRARANPLFPLKVWNDEEQAREINKERWAIFKSRTIFRARVQSRRALFRGLVDRAVL
jgi:lipopolysaccharide biosynthesis glycosyltransferase